MSKRADKLEKDGKALHEAWKQFIIAFGEATGIDRIVKWLSRKLKN
jgi:hypothetical protein